MSALHTVLDTLETSLYHIRATRYLSAAGLVLVLYDHMLTLGDEVRLIWPARTSIVKLLFLINRYTVPFCLILTAYEMAGYHSESISSSFCRTWIGTSAYLGLISLGISNFLLLLRVYAIYEGSKLVLLTLLTAYILCYTATIITATIGIVELLPTVEYSPFIKACIPRAKPRIMSAVWGAPIAFELITAALTAAKAYEHRRTVAKSPLLWVLYRDGAIVFTIILGLRTMNLMIWLFGPLSLFFVGIYFIWSLVTVVIGRMLLNLRGVSTPDEWEEANDAKIGPVLLQDLPILVIGNPNREINSHGEVVEHQPTCTEESGGWPKNYEMARSRSEKETVMEEELGDMTNPEKLQGFRYREETKVSEGRGNSYEMEVGWRLSPRASSSRSTPLILSPQTLVHHERTIDSGTTAMDSPPSSSNTTSRFLSLDVGARVGWFVTPPRDYNFARAAAAFSAFPEPL